MMKQIYTFFSIQQLFCFFFLFFFRIKQKTPEKLCFRGQKKQPKKNYLARLAPKANDPIISATLNQPLL